MVPTRSSWPDLPGRSCKVRKDLGCEHLKGHLGRLSLGSKGKEGLELQGSRSQGKGRFRLRTYKVVLAALVKVAS